MFVLVYYTLFPILMQIRLCLRSKFYSKAQSEKHTFTKHLGGTIVDLTTLLGIVLGIAALLIGYSWDGGHIGALFIPSAMLIVFGGTFGAVAASFPGAVLKAIPEALSLAFKQSKRNSNETISEIVDMATVARREGVLALEQRAQEHANPFLKDGLMMVVDGTDPELTRQILELEMDSVEHHVDGLAKVFDSAGAYAPTMGIIGTVMGLIHVLGNLSDPSSLGPAIAVAFTATLYGVMSANLIYLPIGNKIKIRGKDQVAEMELMLEGILALQAGENPQLIKKKLTSFVHEKVEKAKPEEGAEDGA
jgi:chemotaxis protein MotA